MQRFCLTVDLKNDPQSIEEYKAHHQKVWPEIIQSIHDAGIMKMEIYLLGNRLCMVIEAVDSFSFEMKAKSDLKNGKLQEWETIMWNYQQALPLAKPGEKWMSMEKIFELNGLQSL